MNRYTRIMTAICLTLGAVLMTAALVAVGLGAAMVGNLVHRYDQQAQTASTPAQAPATTPSLAPSPAAGVMDQCRQAFTSGDNDTYSRLDCGLYGN